MFFERIRAKQLHRRQFNLLLAGLGLALTVGACTPKADNIAPTGNMPDEIRIGYQVIPNAELLAKAEGLVEENFPNTTINWIKYSSGGDVNQAMAAGDIDMGLVGSVPVSTGIATELPYQVYFIHDIIGANEALAVRTDAGIVRLEDIRGKKIAVPFGSTTHFSLLSTLKENGIQPNELEIVNMTPEAIATSWSKNEIDGSFVWHPTLGTLLENKGIVLTSAKQLAEEGIITADLAVVHKDFVNQYPDALVQYVAALDKAVDLYRSNPEMAATTLAKELGLTPEQSRIAMDELIWLSADEQASAKYLGSAELPGALAKVLKESAEFMVSQGAIPQAPELTVYNAAIYSEAVNVASGSVASK